jgi:hypothetical protein
VLPGTAPVGTRHQAHLVFDDYREPSLDYGSALTITRTLWLCPSSTGWQALIECPVDSNATLSARIPSQILHYSNGWQLMHPLHGLSAVAAPTYTLSCSQHGDPPPSSRCVITGTASNAARACELRSQPMMTEWGEVRQCLHGIQENTKLYTSLQHVYSAGWATISTSLITAPTEHRTPTCFPSAIRLQ